MSTVDATREEAPLAEEPAPSRRVSAPAGAPEEASNGAGTPPSSVLSASWLLRVAAYAAVVSGILGVIVAPGLRGNANESSVVWIDRASTASSYFLFGVLLALVLWGTFETVTGARGVPLVSRTALVGGASVVVVLSMFGLYGDTRIPPVLAVLIATTTSVTTLAGAYASVRAPHTRALAAVLFAFAFAAIARLCAWECAIRAGDSASMQLFDVSRGLATASTLFEASGQVVAVMWLGTRGRVTGQVASIAALLGACVVMWGVAHGMHSGAALWQAVLHTALADAPGLPPPYAVDAVATFLVPASLLLALVTAAQQRQVAAVVAALSLALVSRGAFDAPLRALCAITAAQWATLGGSDERAMWRALLGDRSRPS